MMYLSIVQPPPGPLANWHVALYGYFPGSKDFPVNKSYARQNSGTQRPYVWRLLDRERVAMLSRIKPACPSVAVDVTAGVAHRFRATLRCDGFRGGRSYIRNNAEAHAWVKRAASDGGGLVTFVHVAPARKLQIERGGSRSLVTVTICDVEGIVVPNDADLFEKFLVFGGPGTAKAYGCGMWWLPDLFEGALGRRAA